MKIFALILTLASFNVFATELNCQGQMIELQATVNPETLTLTKVKIYRYGNGYVIKNKAASLKPWDKSARTLSYELPGKDRENNESWSLEISKTQLKKAQASFKAKIDEQFCVGEDVIALTCSITQN